jgi:8-oxo-dGTP pyrophosphatase MutT (NUDIX family)
MAKIPPFAPDICVYFIKPSHKSGLNSVIIEANHLHNPLFAIGKTAMTNPDIALSAPQALYLKNNAKQVGTAIVTYTDLHGEPHILLARNDPRWPGKNTSDYVHFCGGKIDLADQTHNRVSALPLRLRQGITQDLFAQQKQAGNRLDKNTLNQLHQASKHRETLLEGALREAQEEVNINLTPYLKAADDSFIAPVMLEKTPHPMHGALDIHYFHIHLGKISAETEAQLKQELTPKDDVLMAGFIPQKAIKTNASGATLIEHFSQLAKIREGWTPISASSVKKLSPKEQNAIKALEKSAKTDSTALLEQHDIDRPLQEIYGANTPYDNGLLSREILANLRAVERGDLVPSHSENAPDTIITDITPIQKLKITAAADTDFIRK